MNSLRLILRSLTFHRRSHAGALLGTVVASAIITGALLVGDSVDGTLLGFAEKRIGKVHSAVQARGRFFADSLESSLRQQGDVDFAALLELPGMAIFQAPDGSGTSQVNRVRVLGVDDSFWRLGPGSQDSLEDGEVLVSENLAARLGIAKGDVISLRIGRTERLSRDAPLSARDDDRSVRARLTVRDVLSDAAFGRFGLSASQVAQSNAFVSRQWLQERVELFGLANLLLAGEGVTPDQLDRTLRENSSLEQLGLRLRRSSLGSWQVESDRIFLDEEVLRAAGAVPGAFGTFTYLVNSFAKGGKSTPYSFVVAGPVPVDLGNDEVVINRWLAEAIDASLGDRIEMAYLELLASGDFEERRRSFTVRAVSEMRDLAEERELAPSFPGLSDVESCRDWDVGMPMDEARLQDEANEAYWQEYGEMPKALFTLAAGQAMWGGRFGNLMAVRFPGSGTDENGIRETLRREIDPRRLGLRFEPVRAQALEAVQKAIDFGGLFVGMSFFLIIAALLLTGLLFVFALERRAAETGTLLALGFRPATVRKLILGEAAVIALLGALGGALLGSLYARSLLFGLNRFWPDAVASAAISYHGTPTALALGAGSSLLCALAAMAVAARRLASLPVKELLLEDLTTERSDPRRPGRLLPLLSLAGILLSLAIIAFSLSSDGRQVVMPFFLAGLLLLLSGLGLCLHTLRRLDADGEQRRPTLFRLAMRNISRRRRRSASVVFLLAAGCFLVFAVSTMTEDPASHAGERDSGTGGFELLAESTLGLPADAATALETDGPSIVPIKVREGDDASCLNLNHAPNPPLLGVNVRAMVSRAAFCQEDEAAAFWGLLESPLAGGAVPALVGDTDTAMWGLKKKTGSDDGEILTYLDEAGREVDLKLVGALPMRLSLFQGKILISDEAFTRLYPSEDGYRMLLLDTPPGLEDATAAALNRRFTRFGLDVVRTGVRLREFHAVESSYLAMFLVLGALGLALGSVGMGVVMLRNLTERRAELALMQALGFSARTVGRLLFLEGGVLLLMGIAIGGAAAFVAMLPALLAAEARVDLSTQAWLFALVLAGGIACCAVAVRAGFRREDFSALRDD